MTGPSPSLLRTTLAASFGFALVQLDVTIVNVALPTIAHALGTGTAGLQWVVGAYALAFAALLLTGGYLGDRFGARRIYLAGMALFATASVACGLAGNAPMLIVARMAQGLGAAVMLPCSLIQLSHAAAGDARARAQAVGWWTAAGSITIAAGPIVGGLLLGVAGWRSIFLVNLPICGLGIWLTHGTAETNRKSGRHGFDFAGQLLAVVALGAITGAVIEAKPLGFLNPIVIGLVLAGVAGTIGFVMRERSARAPMLPLELFHSPVFSGAVAYGAVVNFTYYGAVFVLSLYLQRALGYSPVMAGLAFLPLTATFFGVNILSGWWVGRSGSRLPMTVGALVDATGFALLGWVAGPHTAYLALFPIFLLLPGGMGLGVPAMTTALLADVDKEHSGIASAVLNAARQAAGAMGVAVFGSLVGDMPNQVVPGLGRSAMIAVVLLCLAAGMAAILMRRSRPSGEDASRRSA
jgi:DHA2 family methylenomycin A resistance protein-like MFS transporter